MMIDDPLGGWGHASPEMIFGGSEIASETMIWPNIQPCDTAIYICRK